MKKTERAKRLLRAQKRMLKLYPSLTLRNGTLHIGSKPMRRKRAKSQADKERGALQGIVDLLDGTEWEVEMLETIATILRRAGFAIHDVHEADHRLIRKFR